MKCVLVESGFESDPLMHDMHLRFGEAATFNAGLAMIELPNGLLANGTAEVMRDRHTLDTVAEKADGVALWLHGQPPKNRMAVLAGFALGRGIPAVGMRSEKARTGEDGLSFNLMLHAALNDSQESDDVSWDQPLRIARNFKEISEAVSDAVHLDPLRPDKQIPAFPRKDDKPTCYVAGPYGFADSTRGFYYDRLLPLVARHTTVIDPWIEADIEVTAALQAAELTPELLARAWCAVGTSHFGRIIASDCMVVCGDQESLDTGTLVELGFGAALEKPVTLYRNDFRICTEGLTDLDAMVQAAATYYLPKSEAAERVDKFAEDFETLEEHLAEMAQLVR